MGIGFHDDRAGGYEAVFDKDLMANSPADIKELIYPLGGRRISRIALDYPPP
jgi:hypothetical protein